MIDRRALLGGIAAAAVTPAGAAFEAAPSLRALAGIRGTLYGAAAASYQLRQADFAEALKREAGILVPEYECKRDLIEARQGRYEFAGMDALVDFARKNAMAVRGHTLVWYAGNPPWLEQAVANAKDERVLTDYIAVVMGRYRGRVKSWDVVNEAVLTSSGRADGLRNCMWMKRFGPAFIDIAYRAARAADPNAELVYNDWGCEGADGWNDDFRRVTLRLLEGMKKRGVPIDAYGMQGHFRSYNKTSSLNANKLKAFFAELKAMGLRLLVTELDVDDDGGPSDPRPRDGKAAEITARFLEPVMESGICNAIVSWGLSDRYLRGKIVPKAEWTFLPRKLPLDAALGRKPMWHAIADALR